VSDSAKRPLLFLDVDGPLIPFGASPQQYPAGYPVYQSGYELKAASNPLLARIDPGHGPQLMALRCDLVWATTWMNEANECICPRIGLPPMPVVIWPEPSDADDQDERDGLHWKTRPSSPGRQDAPSLGSMTRSPTETGPGYPPTTKDTHCYTALTAPRGSPLPITQPWPSGWTGSREFTSIV
jgi:hypothetical protein